MVKICYKLVILMLYEYLKKNYKLNEPIFLTDIDLEVSNNYLRQMFKVLCDEGKIKRYDTGIYYLPSVSRLKGGAVMAPDMVARYKYISRNGKVEGYYSGYTFANQLGLTTQVPFNIEIVSNGASAKYREVKVKNQKVILRKPKAVVTKDNCNVLQLLDLLKDVEVYADEENADTRELIVKYIRDNSITMEKLDQYISLYPDKVYKNLYEMRLYYVFA